MSNPYGQDRFENQVPDEMEYRNGVFTNCGYTGTASGYIVRDGKWWVATFRGEQEANNYVAFRNAQSEESGVMKTLRVVTAVPVSLNCGMHVLADGPYSREGVERLIRNLQEQVALGAYDDPPTPRPCEFCGAKLIQERENVWVCAQDCDQSSGRVAQSEEAKP